MKVKEIMNSEVISLNPEDNAKEALNILFKRQISGLPVIDAQAKLVGMFTEKDILAYTLPSYIETVGRFIYEENPKSVKRKFMELDKIKVMQIMRKDVVTLTEDTTLCEVARVMLTQKVRRIVVVDIAGKVTGIVARYDVLRALAKEAELPAG